MNLVIDYGNTTAKVGIFEHNELREKRVFSDAGALKAHLATMDVEALITSAVQGNAEQINSWVGNARQKIVMDHQLRLPISISYQTPETLGMDRLAGVCGAVQLFPGKDILVVDAGTCVTYDFIDRNANYQGGAISPGMVMRFKSLKTFTARLPHIEPVADPPRIGKTTRASIQSGVINGLVHEMNGFIHDYQEEYPGLQIVLCGGDASIFENRLKAPIFACPDLVLLGLNGILLHHVD